MRREDYVEPETTHFMQGEREELVAAVGWMYGLIVDRDSRRGRNTQCQIGEVHRQAATGAKCVNR